MFEGCLKPFAYFELVVVVCDVLLLQHVYDLTPLCKRPHNVGDLVKVLVDLVDNGFVVVLSHGSQSRDDHN